MFCYVCCVKAVAVVGAANSRFNRHGIAVAVLVPGMLFFGGTFLFGDRCGTYTGQPYRQSQYHFVFCSREPHVM
jgi:hypothetical protein